jgi:hypothetical protein
MNLCYLQQGWNYQWPRNVCDIIILGSLVAGGDSCYISQVLTTLKTVRYTKRTCTLAKFHLMAKNRSPAICQIWCKF